MLAKAQQELHGHVEQIMAHLDITPRHFGLLLLLNQKGALRQTTIAEDLRLDRTTVTYVVDDLEAKHWVQRDCDPDDRRAHAVQLTASGQDTLAQLRPEADTAEQAFLAPLSDDECTQLKALLRRLI